MNYINRRRFFKASTAAVAVGVATVSQQVRATTADATGHADTIVTGANLLSMDPAVTNVTAMAVRGKRILAVGSDDDPHGLLARQLSMGCF